MKKKVLLVSFLCLMGIITVCNLFAPVKEYSENENRYLAQFPEFSLTALFDGSFIGGFETYVTDQFLARDSWVGIKTISEQVLQKKDSNGVYFADDHYLIETFSGVDQNRFQQNLQFVASFTEKMEAEGVSVQTMLVPTAADILSEKLPKQNISVDQQKLLQQAKETVPHFVDVSGALNQHDGEEIYYRTDHHWTSLGAFYAYQEWMLQNGQEMPAKEDFQTEVLSKSFLGTTYSKVGYYSYQPDVIESYTPVNDEILFVAYNGEPGAFYTSSYLQEKDQYSVFLNGNQPLTEIRTSQQNGRKLLLIKDSYANSFAQFPVADYEEVVLIDLRYFKQPVSAYIAEHGITDVLVLYNLKGFSEDQNMFSLK